MSISKVTISNYITSDGKYPDRWNSAELTLEVRTDAGRFLEVLNNFLAELNFPPPEINSGWRTAEANIKAGGSKFSAHCLGTAIDFKGVELYDACDKNQNLMIKHGIYMEHKSKTPTWTHLTTRRPRSGNRIFYP